MPTYTKSIFYALIIVPLLIFLSSLPSMAQKIEMEDRIKQEAFPRPALDYVAKHYPSVKKIRYYRELSGDSLSFEAKFRLDRRRYSVEFYSDGSLMDVEKQVKFHVLPKNTQEKIIKKWSEDFRKFRVIKCQEQTAQGRIRYEIEIRGKTSQETNYYQYLFESDGSFVDRQVILQRSSDMTLY